MISKKTTYNRLQTNKQKAVKQKTKQKFLEQTKKSNGNTAALARKNVVSKFGQNRSWFRFVGPSV